MANEIEDANILTDGLLITLKDGREALISVEDLVHCAEESGAFTKADKLKAKDEDAMDDHLPEVA